MTRPARARLGAVVGTIALLVAGAPALPAAAHDADDDLRTVVDGLDGPRGVSSVARGLTLVAESDGTFSLVIERRHRPAKVLPLGSVAPGFAPAIDVGRHGKVYILTGAGEPGTGAATLFLWRPGWDEPQAIADIAGYQQTDPDPYNLEDLPEESNPFGVEALHDGSVLVADAAGNDLLRVHRNGDIDTVAVLKPRVVPVPEGFPATDPEGNPLPPAGTPIPSEAVATSVTVGPDGYWYVGELRGFPATPGTSQIWRIKPGSVGAVCDPEAPYTGACRRYSDGLTSIVDLAAGKRGSVYALSLSKKSWLQMEMGVEGAEVGGLFRVKRAGHHTWIRELAKDQLVQPGGVDVARSGDIYVTGPVFGPGSLMKIHD